MDYDKVRELLKKYWEGEAELAEEKLLKDFFSQNRELPQDLEGEKILFGFFKQEESRRLLKEDLTESFKARWVESKETPVKKISPWRQFIKYAAVLVPLLLLGYFLIHIYRNESVTTVQTDTFNDPQKAIAETEKTLLLLSQNMNDGISGMETFKLFDNVKKSRKFKEQQNPFTKK